jgi:hypothetical protein
MRKPCGFQQEHCSPRRYGYERRLGRAGLHFCVTTTMQGWIVLAQPNRSSPLRSIQMSIRTVALISDVKSIPFDQLQHVADALNRQIVDLRSVWKVPDAKVTAYTSRQVAPINARPIIITDQPLGDDAGGYHFDKDGEPYALVEYSTTWTVTASHELLEMLVDPYGRKETVGPAPDGYAGGGEVSYLVEVCDPCEDFEFSYSRSGVPLSDFVTPDYYTSAKTGGTFSFCGNATEPRRILKGGYISFADSSDGAWWQGFSDGVNQVYKRMPADTAVRSRREWVNAKTPHGRPHGPAPVAADHPKLLRYRSEFAKNVAARSNRGRQWLRDQRSVSPALKDLIDVNVGNVVIF